MGWPSTGVPEEYGGAGYGLLELAVLAEELGRALAPIPFSSSVYLAQTALLVAGDEEQRTTWLPPLAAGERIGTAALWEADGRGPTDAPRAIVAAGRLVGTKRPVPDGMAADVAIVWAEEDGEPGLYVVDLSADGVTRRPLPALDPSRPHAEIVFDGAPCAALADGGAAAVERLLDRAAVLYAFEQVGGAQRCLEMTVEYAKERFQFGRPIGSFQAVKHRLADMFVTIELARSNCYYGAWAVANASPDVSAAASRARVAATQAFDLAAQEGLHLHGGIGFTWEADAHLFLKRARSLHLLLGGVVEWRERLVQQLETTQDLERV
jgi:alkylation response protein AidB-like acyl-CoA dehydrogenase